MPLTEYQLEDMAGFLGPTDDTRWLEALAELRAWRRRFPSGLDETGRRTFVCLCGSTRFWRTFQDAALQETLAGRIVLTVGAATASDATHFGHLPTAEQEALKARLDALHLDKITWADEILVLNVDGYVGPSTRREIAFAIQERKRIRWWEPGGGEVLASLPHFHELSPPGL
jgi:hypothetical protein